VVARFHDLRPQSDIAHQEFWSAPAMGGNWSDFAIISLANKPHIATGIHGYK
jgi:hypothetical protein